MSSPGWPGLRKTVDLGIAEALLDFRHSTIDVVREGAMAITLTNVFQQVVQFLVLFVALRGIQSGADTQVTLGEAWSPSRWVVWGPSSH